MNIENITSNEMGLSNNGRFMQIEIYEKEIEKLQQELQRKDNIINELKEWTNSEIKRLEKYQNDKKYVKPYGQEYNNFTILIGAYDNVLDKIEEIESK